MEKAALFRRVLSLLRLKGVFSSVDSARGEILITYKTEGKVGEPSERIRRLRE